MGHSGGAASGPGPRRLHMQVNAVVQAQASNPAPSNHQYKQPNVLKLSTQTAPAPPKVRLDAAPVQLASTKRSEPELCVLNQRHQLLQWELGGAHRVLSGEQGWAAKGERTRPQIMALGADPALPQPCGMKWSSARGHLCAHLLLLRVPPRLVGQGAAGRRRRSSSWQRLAGGQRDDELHLRGRGQQGSQLRRGTRGLGMAGLNARSVGGLVHLPSKVSGSAAGTAWAAGGHVWHNILLQCLST